MPWPDPLEKPEGWIAPTDHLKSKDLSKIRRYKSPDGYTYWLDPIQQAIQTDLPGVKMTFHVFFAFDYEGHSFAKLHFDGGYVVLTKKTADPNHIAFLPTPSERTETGAQIWHVDHLFRSFDIVDHDGFPWVDSAWILPKVRVEGMRKFENLDQQDRCLRLIETLLSCHGGSMSRGIDGRETHGKVVFGAELLSGIDSGEFIA